MRGLCPECLTQHISDESCSTRLEDVELKLDAHGEPVKPYRFANGTFAPRWFVVWKDEKIKIKPKSIRPWNGRGLYYSGN